MEETLEQEPPKKVQKQPSCPQAAEWLVENSWSLVSLPRHLVKKDDTDEKPSQTVSVDSENALDIFDQLVPNEVWEVLVRVAISHLVEGEGTQTLQGRKTPQLMN